MALFVARPSRGSWFFFGLVTLGVLGLRGWRGYERSVVRRDAPITEETQNLAICVLGGDIAWLLHPDKPHEWSDTISQWFRGVTSVRQTPSWPGRCVPMAEALYTRLQRTSNAPEAATTAARQVARALQEAAHDPLNRTAIADTGVFARDLAELLDKVRNISDGTRAGWRPIPDGFQRFGNLTSPRLARLRPLGPEYTRLSLMNGTSLVVHSQRDGRAHRLDLARNGLRDNPLGAAVPFAEMRGALVRAATDQGPVWIVADAAPAVLADPPATLEGADPAQLAWDAAVTPTHVALVTVDRGTARLRIARRGDPRGWSYNTVIGAEESTLGALVAPAAGGFTLTTLHPTLSDAALDQWTVRVGEDPTATTTEGPARRRLAGSSRWGEEFPTFGARVTTCSAGAVRYVVAASEQSLAVARVEGDVVIVTTATATWPRVTATQTSCDATRVLVSAWPMQPRAGNRLFTFDTDTRHGVEAVVEAPTLGPAAVVQSVTLVRDGVLALVSNTGALRAFRYVRPPQARAASWQVGGIVALGTLPRATQRSFARVTARASDNDVVIYLEGSVAQRIQRPPAAQGEAPPPPEVVTTPYTALVASSNGGVDFWAP